MFVHLFDVKTWPSITRRFGDKNNFKFWWAAVAHPDFELTEAGWGGGGGGLGGLGGRISFLFALPAFLPSAISFSDPK